MAFKRIEKAFGRAPIAEIEKADVQSFLTAAAETLAPESIYDLRNRLSGLITSAEEWGWIEAGTNPVRGKLRLPDRVPVRKKRILTPVQFQLLQMALRPPYDTIVLLAVLSGLRKGELEALRWNDVQFGRLEVDEAVYLREIGSPKSRKSRRRVTIGPAVQKALSDWRQRTKFTGPEDFVFAIRTNTPVDLHNVVARHVKPACQKLGLPLVSWHDLRHTYTTWGRRAGIKAEVMRDQPGHVLAFADAEQHLGRGQRPLRHPAQPLDPHQPAGLDLAHDQAELVHVGEQHDAGCVRVALDNADRYYLTPDAVARTIFIDTDHISSTDFHLTAEQRQLLYTNGQ